MSPHAVKASRLSLGLILQSLDLLGSHNSQFENLWVDSNVYLNSNMAGEFFTLTVLDLDLSHGFCTWIGIQTSP